MTAKSKSTGHEKVLVSVCLAAKGDGTKMKPFVVFRGAKREVAAVNECVVATSTNSWMNEELTLIQQVLGTFSFGRRLLAWDSFECHIMDSVKKELKNLNVDQVTVAEGCTKYIQAPDVSWNKQFKSRCTEEYDHWLRNGKHEYTEAGNMRPPSRNGCILDFEMGFEMDFISVG